MDAVEEVGDTCVHSSADHRESVVNGDQAASVEGTRRCQEPVLFDRVVDVDL